MYKFHIFTSTINSNGEKRQIILINEKTQPNAYRLAMHTLTYLGSVDPYQKFGDMGISDLRNAFEKVTIMKSHEILGCSGCKHCFDVSAYRR